MLTMTLNELMAQARDCQTRGEAITLIRSHLSSLSESDRLRAEKFCEDLARQEVAIARRVAQEMIADAKV